MKLLARAYRLGYRLLQPFIRRLALRTKRAKVIVENDGRILLVRNLFGRQAWTLPGGGIKAHEEPAEAAKRELDEELDLQLQQLEDLGIITYEEDGVYFTIQCFRASVSQTQLKVNKWEIIEAEWFKKDQLPRSQNPLLKTALVLLEQGSKGD